MHGAFTFGGYTAGRMARRAGLRNGVLVAVFGVVLLVGVAAVAQFEGATSAIVDRLESLGGPTDGTTWYGVGVVSGAVALGGMILGASLGGVRGERWHQRLLVRAANPDIGPEADLRAEAAFDRLGDVELEPVPLDRGDDVGGAVGRGDERAFIEPGELARLRLPDLRVDRAREDQLHLDAAAGEVDARRLAPSAHGGLRRAVGGLVHDPEPAAHARHVHDEPAASVLHAGEERHRHADGREEVDVHRVVHVLDREVEGVHALGDG